MDDTDQTAETVAIIGAGTMGAGIAQLCAGAGYRALLIDTSLDVASRGRERVADFLSEGVNRGKTTESQREATLNAIQATADLDAVRQADFIVEAVVEDRDIKCQVVGDVSQRSKTAIIATNTSAIPIAVLAGSVHDPTRFAGLHFFNPPQLMRLVEIVPSVQTSDSTISALRVLVDRLGKKSVVARDRPGFLVNNLLMPYLNQVIRDFDAGLASAEDIDTATQLGLGYPMGPLKLLDLIGLDVHLHATQAAYDETYEERFAPPPLLRRMVSAGQIGNKSGHGFYVHEEKS